MFISSKLQTLIKILAIAAMGITANAQFINKKWKEQHLITPSGQVIKVSWALKMMEQTKGLSGLRPEKMKKDEGLLFYYHSDSKRVFWMPDTYFDLDIIFLHRDMKVVGIEHSIPHFPKYEPRNKIPVTKEYVSRSVLEIHAGQSQKLGIKVGSQLKWKKPQQVKNFLKSQGIK